MASHFRGAGILLYDYHPKTGTLIFLLGKEYRPDEPYVHNKFCEFGGNAKDKEDPLSTALRELKEEGMGLINPDLNDKPIEAFVSLTHPNTYYTFLIKYPFSEEIVEKYNNLFKATYLDRKNHKGYYEKSELKWWTINEVKINGPQNILFFSDLIKVIKKKWTWVV